MSSTLNRLRASFRSKKKKGETATIANKTLDLNQKSSQENRIDPEERFTISYQTLELGITSSKKFIPESLRIHYYEASNPKKRIPSSPAPWEPSLRTSDTGFAIWVPPFVFSVPRKTKLNDDEERDVFFVLENTNSKGKRKELAKTRLNLNGEFKEPGISKDFKIKLRPLSSKVTTSHLDLSISRSFQTIKSDLDREFLASETSSRLSVPIDSPPLLEPSSPAFSAKSVSPETTDNIHAISPPPDLVTPTISIENLSDNLPPIASPEKISSEKSTPPNSSPKKSLIPELDKSNFHFTVFQNKKIPIVKKAEIEKVALESDALMAAFRNNSIDDSVGTPEPIVIPDSLLVATPASPAPPSRHITSTPMNGTGDLLSWCKTKVAESSNKIKITNLSSSWMNGIGFCLLLHGSYPELIPLSSLENHNQASNRRLAYEASKLIGINGIPDTDPPERVAICIYLKEMKEVLSKPKMDIELEKIDDFKRNFWMKESSGSREMTPCDENVDGVLSPREVTAVSPNLSKEEIKLEPSIEKPIMRKKSPLIQKEIRQSIILLNNELKQLSKQEEKLSEEQAALMKDLENNNDEEKMKRYIAIVNEKDSLVRKQMLLNLKEKESGFNERCKEINIQLQEYMDVDDSMKTEKMKEKEQILIDELVSLVDEKNKILHLIDNQEKAIDVDTMTYDSSMAGSKIPIRQGDEECVIS